MTLYEINNQIQEALEKAVDPETGEINENMYAYLDELTLARDEKAENVALWIKNLKADAAAIKEEAKNLSVRARVAENRADRLTDYLQYCLHGDKFSTARVSVSYRHSKKVEFDENRLSEVPEQFLRYKDPELDKKAVTDALKAGQEVPGCKLVENVSMIIK